MEKKTGFNNDQIVACLFVLVLEFVFTCACAEFLFFRLSPVLMLSLALASQVKTQPRSQGLLRFQDGSRHLESGVDPGNEVGENQALALTQLAKIYLSLTSASFLIKYNKYNILTCVLYYI